MKPELPIELVRSEPLLDADERLRRAVQPVLDELVTKLSGTNSAIVLADHRAVIIDRRGTNRGVNTEMDRLAILSGHDFGEGSVGTNGVGTAAEERRLVRVAGGEHYADIFKHLTCYGVPLVHPLNRRLIGVLDLTFPQEEEHPLMPSFMEDAGRRIEGLLAEWASLRERAQFEYFLALSRQSRRAVLSTMDDAVLLNRSARQLDPVDQAALLRAAGEVTEDGHGAVLSLPVGDQTGPVTVRVHTQSEHARFRGVVLEVLPSRPRRSHTRPSGSLPGLVGTSAAWTAFASQAAAAAGAGAPVLLIGEGGTGKLAAARALHELLGRAQLAVVDLATALAEGRQAWLRTLRSALQDTHTTVVLRHLELADPALSAAIAAEIDRLSDPGPYLIATLTTGSSGPGTQALFDRFCLHLEIPPLRERRDDIDALVRCFVRRHAPARSLQFHPGALAVLRTTDFPGNVRELEAVIKGIVATGRSGEVLPADLPSAMFGGPVHLTPMERVEREALIKALRLANGNKASAAAALGISRQTLYRKIAIYRIESD